MKADEPNHAGQVSFANSCPANAIPRLIAVAAIIVGVAGLFAYAGGWLTPQALTPARIADGFETVNGTHPGFRRNHAKGIGVSGYFESNGQGAALSKASVFRAGRVPIIGRFSLSGGKPYAADAAQTVRGLAILFMLPHGDEWRTAVINLPVFPVRTPLAFYEQLLASAPDAATGKPDPAKMKTFLDDHPETATAFQLIRGQPKSSGFENTTFNSLNAFRFINADGAEATVRWSLVPGQPSEAAKKNNAGESDTNYLFDALIAGIQRHALDWRLVITVAQPGDPSDDATVPWPPERKQIDVGTLTVNHVESDDASTARDINFDPLVLPVGIAPSDDPLLSARSAVYSQSFRRREGEHKEDSAISAAEAGKER